MRHCHNIKFYFSHSKYRHWRQHLWGSGAAEEQPGQVQEVWHGRRPGHRHRADGLGRGQQESEGFHHLRVVSVTILLLSVFYRSNTVKILILRQSKSNIRRSILCALLQNVLLQTAVWPPTPDGQCSGCVLKVWSPLKVLGVSFYWNTLFIVMRFVK